MNLRKTPPVYSHSFHPIICHPSLPTHINTHTHTSLTYSISAMTLVTTHGLTRDLLSPPPTPHPTYLLTLSSLSLHPTFPISCMYSWTLHVISWFLYHFARLHDIPPHQPDSSQLPDTHRQTYDTMLPPDTFCPLKPCPTATHARTDHHGLLWMTLVLQYISPTMNGQRRKKAWRDVLFSADIPHNYAIDGGGDHYVALLPCSGRR